jgi:hypothetical protein
MAGLTVHELVLGEREFRRMSTLAQEHCGMQLRPDRLAALALHGQRLRVRLADGAVTVRLNDLEKRL